ncbi:MAG: hypothetical protein LYZ66_04760 [Nitrososphaerales archaeon]|nr:hypothetical protein [Nitrososphaerales archaeon]
MSLTAKRLVVIALICLLGFSFLQVLPVAHAQAATKESGATKPLPAFKLRGPAPDSLPVLASIAIPLRNVDILSSLVGQVSDPTSPMFRHFLTDQQVAQEFLPTDQYNAMMSYLSGTGLKVQFTALDSIIVVRGTVAQLKESLGTNVNVYTNGTASYYIASASSFKGAFLYASNATYILARKAVASQPSAGANVTFTSGAFSAKQLQAVYNATGLYAQGINGTGKTIGILDWFGSPTIANDLKQFDSRFGFPDPNFQILPIGPYDPNLGAFTGWSTEVSLDVEVSHAMAPGASVVLYVANNALSQADVIAKVVKDNKVNTLSQSYTFPEWLFSFFGPSIFEFNVLLPDQYYMLGSLKGITFMGATGDTGGSGFTSGVEGQLGYPASSPYNTAVGGTQTYFAGSTFIQTAWSNPGFVPNGVNYGGSTGGVSIVEPKPWYQAGLPTPPTFPNGRMNPDLSLQGGVGPATYIVDSGRVVASGGTSESAPLFAGLVTLIDQYVKGSVGLINPFLYSLGNSPAAYAAAFMPIRFGYNVPWTASFGYNLVTGLGAPNIGEMASIYRATATQPSLNITVQLSRGVDSSHLEYTPGTVVTVSAAISSGSSPVTSGSFTATLVTLKGQSSVPLTYNAGARLWTGRYTMGAQSGMAYMQVQGASGGVSGSAFATLFAGYLGQFYGPVPTDPWSTIGGLNVVVQSLTLDGNLSSAAPLQMEVDSYSILSNQYRQVDSISIPPSVTLSTGPGNMAVINRAYPSGPMTFVLDGSTYGYLPFVNGIYLQTTYIYPEVSAEPGSVAPGQKLTIVADPIAPFNLYFTASSETGSYFGADLEHGANVTAMLLDANGSTISRTHLAYQRCAEALKVCGGGAANINGYLDIPSATTPGLHTILIVANYSSYTIGHTVNGTFYSQVWVSKAPIVPTVSVLPGQVSATAPEAATPTTGSSASNGASGVFFEGQTAHVEARINYPNGTAVKFGEYTALVYPQELANDYTKIMHSEYANDELTSLVYNPSIGAWVGNVTLPSPYSSGALGPINNNSFYYSGPYEVYVTGISADGVPTTTAISAQHGFFIQPYVYMSGPVSALAQTSGLVFSGATIGSAGVLAGDLFIGSNTISGGSLTITSSQIQGTLTIKNARVTLTGVSGGDVNATGSSITLQDSSIGTLTLTGSNVTLANSSYQQVSPARASISFGPISPQPASGKVNVTATVTGSLLTAAGVTMWVDGSLVQPSVAATTAGLTATATLDASALADGVHTVAVAVAQADGISSSASTFVTTNSHLASLSAQLKSTMQEVGNILNISYGLAVVAVVGVAVAIMALRRKATRGP